MNDDTTIDALIADPQNRRTHPARNLDMIAASLRSVGAGQSIVIDERGEVLAGNGVLSAARAAGLSKVQIVEADGETIIAVRRRNLTDDQKRELALYDNRTAELSTWDGVQLAADLEAGADLSKFFDDEELITALGASHVTTGRTDPDAVPDVRGTDIQRGDLFALGAHRLLCGDSTRPEDVARAMGEARANLVFTSPPYGQQRDYGAVVSDWESLMRGVCACLPTHDTTQVLINLGLVHRDSEWFPYWDPWITWMREQGWRRFGWYVWDQGFGLPGDWNGRLGPSHEFVFHFNRTAERARKSKEKHAENVHVRTSPSTMRRRDGTVKPFGNNAASAQPRKILDSVIRVTRQSGRIGKGLDHPAVFPVALPVEILSAFSDRDDVVYEPFGGSGTQMIAAEQLHRRCVTIDIEPQYVQVAIDRWEAFTGLKAEKV